MPVAAVFEVVYQRLKSTGAHDVYTGGELAVLQGVHQGAGDGAVAESYFEHVAWFILASIINRMSVGDNVGE